MILASSYPGATLQEELSARGLSAAALSRKLAVTPGRLQAILHGHGKIDAEMALRLGCCFGNEAEFWMNLQTQHDLAKLRRTQTDKIYAEVEPAA